MSEIDEKGKFRMLVKELQKCGYLESEIYAIARIDAAEINSISEDKLSRGRSILKNQLEFAKKCLNVI